MAHSIEARVPMLDYELATFAVNCRPSLKLQGGWTKWMLRQAMNCVLPEAVRLRKSKLGFSTPQQEWPSKGRSRNDSSMIHEPDLKMSRILSAKKVHDELDAFLSDKSGCLTEVEAFRVLNLELWGRVRLQSIKLEYRGAEPRTTISDGVVAELYLTNGH